MTSIVLSLHDQITELRYPKGLERYVALLFGAATDAAGAKPKRVVTVRDMGPGRYSIRTSPGSEVIGDLDVSELLAVLLEEITRSFVVDLDSAVALHAATIGWQDTSIVIAGPTGAGKTSLAGWFVANGFQFLSDELVVLPDRRGATLIFPRPLLAESATDAVVRILAKAGHGKTIAVGGQSLICLDPAPAAPIPERRASLVIFPKYAAGSELELSFASRGLASAKLMECNLNARNISDHGMSILSAFARDVPALTLSYGDFEQLEGTIDVIAKLVAERSMPAAGLGRIVAAFGGQAFSGRAFQGRLSSAPSFERSVSAGSAPEARAFQEQPLFAPNTSASEPAVSAATIVVSDAANPVPRAASKKLTIGMATYDDYDGVYFSVQALRVFHPEILDQIEILVVDNHPDGPCAEPLKQLESYSACRYIANGEITGTAIRDVIFREAAGEFVLCMDCHVFVFPGALKQLLDYFDAHPDTKDLLQGPLYYDNLKDVSTHFKPEWSGGMYGTWGTDQTALDKGEPFEIPMQGLGLFACRRAAWPGFNPAFRGFGGEEGYIHEKFRRRGGRALCLPFLRWLHRFNRPMGASYPNRWDDRVRNYLIGFRELGLDTAPIVEHFKDLIGESTAADIVARLEYELAADTNLMAPSLTTAAPAVAATAVAAAEPESPVEAPPPGAPNQSEASHAADVRPSRGPATRAIVCCIEDNKHLVQQALALRQSWLYVQSPDTDLVVMGPPSALAQIPDDVVRIEQRAVADDPEWRGYRYSNSIATFNGVNAHRLDRYAYLLNTDADTFITPAWNDFHPDGFVCGTGGYSNDDNVRQKLRDISAQFGLEHRGLTNTGSTWYGPTALVRRVAALSEMLARYLLSREFRENEGQWPGWYGGVSTLYASEIAINHLVPGAVKSDKLDFYSTSRESVRDYPHIHCWHTDEKFSKHWFMAGRYTAEDARNLNLDVIADYAVEMSFRSLKDMPATTER